MPNLQSTTLRPNSPLTSRKPESTRNNGCLVEMRLPSCILDDGAAIIFAGPTWGVYQDGSLMYTGECGTCHGEVEVLGARPGFCHWCGAALDPIEIRKSEFDPTMYVD